ncbi:hypothetical protein D3C72_1087920 [compost metagenome]
MANAVSDTAWSLPADQPTPSAAEVGQLAHALHAMSVAVVGGTAVPTAAISAPIPALADVAAEIESLRAALAGPDFAAAPLAALPKRRSTHPLTPPSNQV